MEDIVIPTVVVMDKKCVLFSLWKPPFDPQPFINKSEVLLSAN